MKDYYNMLFKEIQNIITNKKKIENPQKKLKIWKEQKEKQTTKNTNYSTYIDVVLIISKNQIMKKKNKNTKTKLITFESQLQICFINAREPNKIHTLMYK